MLIGEARVATAHAGRAASGEPGFGLAGGCVVVVVVALAVAGLIAPRDLGVRAAAMAVVVGVLAAVLRDRRAVLGVMAVAALIFVGFLDHRYGVLTGAAAWKYTLPIAVAAALGRAIRLVDHGVRPTDSDKSSA